MQNGLFCKNSLCYLVCKYGIQISNIICESCVILEKVFNRINVDRKNKTAKRFKCAKTLIRHFRVLHFAVTNNLFQRKVKLFQIYAL